MRRHAMPTAAEVLDREFLDARAKLLSLAATLDRIDRAEGILDDISPLTKLRTATELLLRPTADRAEQVQLLFSRPYNEEWREEFGVK
jgi:hypothetical protein